jgi:acetyltransferase-like isoleucine patch superfamily enzyme
MNVFDVVRMKRRIHQYVYRMYLKSVLDHLGRDTDIDPSLWLYNPDKIVIGDEVQVRRGVVMDGRTELDRPGIVLSHGVHIKEYAHLDAYGGFIQCGEDVRIGQHSIIAGHGGIVFEDWSGVAGLSYVIAANHTFKDPSIPFVAQPETKQGIRIGEGAWCASGVIILDGVTIGDHAVVGAGAVVRKDVDPFTVVLGNPARVAYKFDTRKPE